jgi:hypothetical protein
MVPYEDGHVEDYQLASGIVKLPKGHALAEACYQFCQDTDREKVKWGEVGPQLLTRLAKEMGLFESSFPADYFSPLPWWDWFKYLRDDLSWMQETTHGVHLYHEMWRRMGEDDKTITWLNL